MEKVFEKFYLILHSINYLSYIVKILYTLFSSFCVLPTIKTVYCILYTVCLFLYNVDSL